MAASKSVSRKSVAKKARKTRETRAAAKKASKTRKQRAAGKKTAATRKRRTVAKKALVPRKTKAAVATRAMTTVNIDTRLQRRRMPEGQPTIAEIDDRIAIVRDNLRELVERASSYSGASDEEMMSRRIAEQEAKLELLKKQREELFQAIATWQAVEKVGVRPMTRNKRIGGEAILNRSCVAVAVGESMLLVGTLQNPSSTAC